MGIGFTMTDTSLHTDEDFASPSSRKRFIATMIGFSLITVLFIGMAAFIWQDSEHWRSVATDFFEQARGTPWALPLVCAAYIVSGLIMFPIALLNLIVAIVFGLWGIMYGLIGVMLNTVIFFWVGSLARKTQRGQELLTHPKIKPIDKKLKDIGLAGMVAVHALPAPPFTILNFIAGLSSVTAVTFFLGTFLAMLPGAIARGVVGESLSQIILNPTPESYIYLAGGVALWIVLVVLAHFLLKHFQDKEKTAR
jgi:phospholipase D1/2